MVSESSPQTVSDCLERLYAVLNCLDQMCTDRHNDQPNPLTLAAIHVQQAIDLIHKL